MKIRTYDELNARSNHHGETNDCAVITLAACTGISYEAAHNTMRNCGRLWRDGSYTRDLHAAFKLLGYALEPTRDVTGTTKNLNHPIGGVFLILTGDHFSGLVHGRLVDWSHHTAKRVQFVWRVTKRPGKYKRPGTTVSKRNKKQLNCR